MWQAHYGQISPRVLPFGVGEGTGDLPGILPFPELVSARAQENAFAVSPADAKLWQTVLEALSLQMTQAPFAEWLAGARLVSREGNRFVVAVLDEATLDWVSKRLREPILRTLRHVAEEIEVQVAFVRKTSGPVHKAKRSSL